ncbi:JAB domain-containing protein, partial [Enterococcus faecium]|uniref:JAB domain-containing protein n=1 Tax=Enterococcus faecium TaxID=1352 RepID=UPI0029530D56
IIGNPSLNHRYRKGFYSLFKTLQQNLIERPIEYQVRISSTKLAAQIGMAEIGDEAQEVFLLVVLNTQNEINAIHRVFQGSLNSSVAQPREIFRSALLNNGAKIMLYHNHPSGNLLTIV